jgi:putative DNA primase/helicase
MDRFCSAEEARRQIRAAGSAFLDSPDENRVHALGATTGTAKTQITIELTSEWLHQDPQRTVLYVVPRHELGEEIVKQFAKYGIRARVYRGREADDPDEPGGTMCLDLPAVEDAIACGQNVQQSCCKHKKRDGRIQYCVHHPERACGGGCSFQLQFLDPPRVWVAARNLLFVKQRLLFPEQKGTPSVVIIDESFVNAGQREPVELPLVAIQERARPRDARVRELRKRLERALNMQAQRLEPGERTSLTREAVKRIISVEDCARAYRLEHACLPHPRLYPGMPESQRKRLVANTNVSETLQIIDIWEELKFWLAEDEKEMNGRISLQRDKKTGAPFVRLHTIQRINEQWLVPTFILDATLPGLPILRTWYRNVEVVADINVRAPHAHVRQVLGAPVSQRKLQHHNRGSELEQRNAEHRRELLHYVLERWLECGRGKTLVVAQKEYAEWLRQAALPGNIHVAHYNNLSGLDGFKDVRLLICLGRTAPRPLVIEDAAGALSGEAPETVIRPGSWWYQARRAEPEPGMVMMVDRHPDPLVEALRWQACEGGILQAIGRARAINRTAADPVDIDILADVLLPLELDTVQEWQRPSPLVVMLSRGLMLTSPVDMARAWPDVWPNERAAQRCLEAAKIRTNASNGFLYTHLSGSSGTGTEHLRPFRYQPAGVKQRWREAYFDPATVLDLKTELEAMLHVSVRIELRAAA